MKRLTLLALLLAAPAIAQVPVLIQRAPLALAFDLDGEAADDNKVIAATALVDNGTSVADADWTILAQPDICRLLDLTIVDTDLSAGSITVTGLDCMGQALVSAFAFTAGDDTGVQTLTVSSGHSTSAYYSSVTTVTTGVMTGESDETFALGYTTVPTNAWVMYGRLKSNGPSGERHLSVWEGYDGRKPITTAGVNSTTVTSVNTDSAFELVSAGDLLIFNVAGTEYQRKVTARASADSITINSEVNIPATGVTFRYKKLWVSTDPLDATAFFIPVSGSDAGSFIMSVNANANTGGIVSNIECAVETAVGFSPLIQVDTDTVASGSTGTAVSAIDFRLVPYTHCAFGLWFGTNDDADAADEDIDIVITLSR